MPLPALPDNNTVRAWLKYNQGGTEHELCFRLASGATGTQITTVAASFANALKTYLDGAQAFTSLRYSAAGSDLSFPLAWTPIAGTGATPLNDRQRASFVALSGRSSGGYRSRITYFWYNFQVPDDFRGNTTGANAGAALYAAATTVSPALVAKDGNPMIWNAYVNQGINAYWQRQFR